MPHTGRPHTAVQQKALDFNVKRDRSRETTRSIGNLMMLRANDQRDLDDINKKLSGEPSQPTLSTGANSALMQRQSELQQGISARGQQITDFQTARSLRLDPAEFRTRRKANELATLTAQQPSLAAGLTAQGKRDVEDRISKRMTDIAELEEGGRNRRFTQKDITERDKARLVSQDNAQKNRVAQTTAMAALFDSKAAFAKATNSMSPKEAARIKVIGADAKIIAAKNFEDQSDEFQKKTLERFARNSASFDTMELAVKALVEGFKETHDGAEPTKDEVEQMMANAGIFIPAEEEAPLIPSARPRPSRLAVGMSDFQPEPPGGPVIGFTGP